MGTRNCELQVVTHLHCFPVAKTSAVIYKQIFLLVFSLIPAHGQCSKLVLKPDFGLNSAMDTLFHAGGLTRSFLKYKNTIMYNDYTWKHQRHRVVFICIYYQQQK